MITPTTMSMKNPVRLGLMMFMVCVVSQVVHGEQKIRCIPEEREALLQFRAAIVDEYGMLSSWTTPHCCQWEGIRCTNLTSHIIGLHLPAGFPDEYDSEYKYMRGEIHKSLMELPQLQYLNLSSNLFEDSHIPEFLGSLKNLKYLDLSSCYFGGEIPSQFGSLSHLKYLNLASNSLNGSIPHQLGNLSQLQCLDLSYNNFEGNIPSQLGNLSQLHELYLASVYGINLAHEGKWLSNLFSLTHLDLSSVSNPNPSHSWLKEIAKLPKLRELSLVDCSLSDHFILSSTSFKFNFSTSLSVLDLSWNTFTSTMVFQWVSNITSNLVELDLSYNLLKGSISSDFVMVMNSLRHLDLSSNSFKDKDLKSLMNSCTLHSLNMAANNLTEDLSSILSNLSGGCVRHSLQEFDLSQNQITGNLLMLSGFSSLKELFLNQNNLSGEIPQDIMLPPNLESLSIMGNSFEGGIPKSFGNACALCSLDISYNSLSKEFSMIINNLSGCARNSLQELSLRGNKINGTLPDLSIFLTLKGLDLSENQLNGKVSEGSKLPSSLEYLSTQSNKFEGGIPKSFGNACALRSLDMSNNSLSEEFPKIIHHLSGCARYSLEELNLNMNQINGTLPDFSIFTSLKRLYVGENMLNGWIPRNIQFPPQLEILDIHSNYLEGVLTDYHFANVSKLQELYLFDNSLALVFTQNWVPPFQLFFINLRSCKLGPTFPKWLKTQNKFYYIDISNASISDVVPEWFWANLQLQEMISVDISYNNLRGIIPNFPPKYLLHYVSLGSNQFDGPIPQFLRNSGVLDLSKNKFSSSSLFLCLNGTIETLYQLDLSNNRLSGQIPDCWSHFKSLTYLDLSYNNFSGKIPTSMGSLFDLQALLLRNNNLTSGIPLSLRSCTKLVMLDMAENKLSGIFPAWIGSSLKKLQFLSLRSNNLYGTLPIQICYLRNIQLLDLSINYLFGKIPKCIKNFVAMAKKTSSEGYHHYSYHIGKLGGTNSYELNEILMWKGSKQMFMNEELSLLKSIDFSSNHFSKEIPMEIEDLFELVSLNLSRNNLIGKIPSNIGKLASLEFLDLSRNKLVGSIPTSLAQINRLTMLDLSHNYLSGEIPIGTQLQSFNASSYENNLDLCGLPLEKLCIKPAQDKNLKIHQDEYSFLNNDFLISMAFGFVISFLMVFFSILFERSWRHAYFKFLNKLADNIYVKVAVFR
ncbi:receptor-like protein EIX1 [Vigna unguiculata]|uniref:receptor-like protein EIX1 n=1 Tax=Vigna unguiculata TaxID=3917 RepID=UPI0010167E95|nr:receptor-like protein EIX1 [Vigna unguiculata]